MADDFFDCDDLFGDSDKFTISESDADRTLTRLSEYLLDEVAEMYDLVQSISQEVSDVQTSVTDKSKTKRELFAVVESTASATNLILEQAELIESLSKKLPQDAQDSMIEYVTKIYEACTFQDITGQRIKKVVTTIITIEEHLSKILLKINKNAKLKHIENADESTITQPKVVITSELSDKELMQGPSLPEGANSQIDIDNLFKK